jgi:hypothetical protein
MAKAATATAEKCRMAAPALAGPERNKIFIEYEPAAGLSRNLAGGGWNGRVEEDEDFEPRPGIAPIVAIVNFALQ